LECKEEGTEGNKEEGEESEGKFFFLARELIEFSAA
jgi:hypothetical protein